MVKHNNGKFTPVVDSVMCMFLFELLCICSYPRPTFPQALGEPGENLV